MFISGYTPSRLQIWRNYSNSGFPVSQQPALKPITNQNVNIGFPLFASLRTKVYAMSAGNTANPLLISSNNGLSFPANPLLPVAQIWRGLCDTGTRLIATGGTGQTDIAYSDDNGVTWFALTVLSPADWGQCAFGNGAVCVANTLSNVVSRSINNGASFSIEPSGFTAGSIVFLGGFFYHFSGAACERSVSGLAGTWARCKYDSNLDFGSNSRLTIIYAMGVWVCAFNNLILISADGLTFSSVRLPITYTPTAIVYANDNFIFLSANVSGVIITSADLVWFTMRTNYTSIAMPDGLASSTGQALLRDSAGNLRVPDTAAYEVSYV